MEYGPLPPHERTWRHPSELAAEEHAAARSETVGATTRMFAFTTGTVGLLAVGLLIVAITPGRNEAPVAVSATIPSVAGSAVALASTAPGSPARAPVGLRSRPEALATPIGEGHFAVVTTADLVATGGDTGIGAPVEVAVPSGRMHDARIVGRAGDSLLVELEWAEPGIELADERPGGDEIVTLMAEPPVTVVLDELASLDVEEGTAVVDDEGELVGLCSQGPDETRLVMVNDRMLDTDGTTTDDVGVTPTRSTDVPVSDGSGDATSDG